MILDLNRLPSNERISGDEVVLFGDIAGEENRIHCHVELDIRRRGDTFYIHADLSGEFSTPCHRCLEPTPYKVSPSFELVVQKANLRSEPETISEDDNFVRLPAGQNRLEFDQYIYENLLVDIPITITCRDDCRGLCTGCGVNLNREECRCSAAPDARWNELRKLKESE
jgi:uncharacterized protein